MGFLAKSQRAGWLLITSWATNSDSDSLLVVLPKLRGVKLDLDLGYGLNNNFTSNMSLGSYIQDVCKNIVNRFLHTGKLFEKSYVIHFDNVVPNNH